MALRSDRVPVEEVSARAFTVPTDRPESDGTFAWDRTTLVLARVRGGGAAGIGYTYAHPAAASSTPRPAAPSPRATSSSVSSATPAPTPGAAPVATNYDELPGVGWSSGADEARPTVGH